MDARGDGALRADVKADVAVVLARALIKRVLKAADKARELACRLAGAAADTRSRVNRARLEDISALAVLAAAARDGEEGEV